MVRGPGPGAWSTARVSPRLQVNDEARKNKTNKNTNRISSEGVPHEQPDRCNIFSKHCFVIRRNNLVTGLDTCKQLDMIDYFG